MRDSPKTRGPNPVQPELAESEIEQMFGGVGSDPLAPPFRRDQMSDFAFFSASQNGKPHRPTRSPDGPSPVLIARTMDPGADQGPA
jgi:hypothetical protein